MNGSEQSSPFEERHFTIRELSRMWRFSEEFVRQIVKDEPGVTEWVRQQPGRRRYRVLRVPQSVAERLYNKALGKAEEESRQRSGNAGHTIATRRHGLVARRSPPGRRRG
jgi:hypothetical protein